MHKMSLSFVCMFYFVFKLFFGPKIYVTITSRAQSYHCRSKTLQIGHTFDKTLVKQRMQVRISNLIVIFFNKMR